MMMDHNSADYYRGRERQERTLAQAALNPAIADIHLEMADRYAMLAGDTIFTIAPRLRRMRSA